MSPLAFGLGSSRAFGIGRKKVSIGFRYSGFNISLAVNGVFGDSTNPPNTSAEQTQMRNDHNAGGTATFSPGVPYSTLEIIYGNMSNGSLGNPAGGAVLSINGSAISATGTYGTSPYNATYHKRYFTSTPGTLNSIGISNGVSGSHESGIYEILIDGTVLTATPL
jgi:hypothetical protein